MNTGKYIEIGITSVIIASPCSQFFRLVWTKFIVLFSITFFAFKLAKRNIDFFSPDVQMEGPPESREIPKNWIYPILTKTPLSAGSGMEDLGLMVKG